MKLAYSIYVVIIVLFLPSLLQAQTRVVHAEWSYQDFEGLAGFRLYYDDTLACEINDPTATSMDCEIDVPDGTSWFTMTCFMEDGTESAHSEPFSYTFSSELLAQLNATPIEGTSPLTVDFDASSSTGNIDTFAWTFGDGDSAQGITTSHTFTIAGSYDVTLVVTDKNGATSSKVQTVVVNSGPTTDNTPPTAVISSSTTLGNAPLLVELDGGGSSDDDGTIISYNWDLGDGGTATGSLVNYTYSTAGTYYPTLTVTDDDGAIATVNTPVLVRQPTDGNIVPTAYITATSTSGETPLVITVDASNSTDPDGSINRYTWNFGDGSSGTGKNLRHTYTEEAKYRITLIVTDNSGASSQPATLTIDALAPGKEDTEKKIDLLPIFYLLLLSPEK